VEAEKKPSKAEVLKKKIEEYEKQLKDLEAKENAAAKKREVNRKMIVGEAVIAHAYKDAGFAKALQKILTDAVTKQRDIEMIDDLMSDTSTEENTAEESASTEEISAENKSTGQSDSKL
jgi:ABC-type Zn uptake system ZnuABC Zn-binding protein ZnuA